MSHHRFRIVRVQPAVAAASVSHKRPHTQTASGTSTPTVEGTRDGLLNRSLDRSELDAMGLAWQDDRHAIYHAGGDTFRLTLEPEGVVSEPRA